MQDFLAFFLILPSRNDCACYVCLFELQKRRFYHAMYSITFLFLHNFAYKEVYFTTLCSAMKTYVFANYSETCLYKALCMSQ